MIRLGQDTVGLERYTRTATQLKGEYPLRAPRPVHALFTADLDADGALRRFELITHNIAGGPGPAETRSTVEITGDSAVITIPRGDSSVTFRMGDARQAVLWGGYTVALYEHLARRARAAGAATFTSPVLTAGQLSAVGTPLEIVVERVPSVDMAAAGRRSWAQVRSGRPSGGADRPQ